MGSRPPGFLTQGLPVCFCLLAVGGVLALGLASCGNQPLPSMSSPGIQTLCRPLPHSSRMGHSL